MFSIDHHLLAVVPMCHFLGQQKSFEFIVKQDLKVVKATLAKNVTKSSCEAQDSVKYDSFNENLKQHLSFSISNTCRKAFIFKPLFFEQC